MVWTISCLDFLEVEIVTKDEKPASDLGVMNKNELRSKFILISTDGPYDNVLKIKPPLYFSKENANTLLEELDKILIKTEKN